MRVRAWPGRPRQLLIVFLAVAGVSVAALVWLGILLFNQDKALAAEQRQERLEQAADRATAAMARELAELQASLGPTADRERALSAGVVIVSVDPHGLTVVPDGRLLYVPVTAVLPEAPAALFAEAERLEFAARDFAGAARRYTVLAAAPAVEVRAGALARLARVSRRLHDPAVALRTYTQLARIDRAAVGGLPASLVARVGAASVFAESGRTMELREEAKALVADLSGARWSLTKSQFDFYSTQAAEWLGTAPEQDADALTAAEAADWLWRNHSSERTASRRSIALPSGPAFLSWTGTADRLDAVIGGPAYLRSLCAESIGGDFLWTLSDQDGRVLLGAAPPERQVAIRTATASGLPWSLHVFAPPGAAVPSPRRLLLVTLFTVVALVLAAGWYFILRAMARELRVSRLQADFVAAVSHEFRSPLTSLAHIAHLLVEDRFPSGEARRKSYGLLARETDRLRRLVEGLLDFGRFEAGTSALRMEAIDLGRLVADTVADFQDRVAADGYSIELIGPSGAINARVDREAISRALWNLLDNAVKYSPSSRMVWVEVVESPNRVAINVRDRGLGIPPHERREIFDRFVRGRDSKALRIKGTGIGLAMVRQIVQAHGGTVTVQSEVGAGSTFTIVLPRDSSGLRDSGFSRTSRTPAGDLLAREGSKARDEARSPKSEAVSLPAARSLEPEASSRVSGA